VVPRPAPEPVAAISTEAGLHRVVEHVLDRVLEVSVVPDHPRSEPLLEEVALPSVALVEALRVDADEPVHRAGDVGELPFDDHVVVRAEQAPGVQPDAEARGGDTEQPRERLAVVVVAEDEDAACSAARQVVHAAGGKLGARSARHRRATVVAR
jgi:hypothetical protein